MNARSTALDEGADDHLAERFGPAERPTRIRAVLHRRPAGPEAVRHGPPALGPRTRQVAVDGRTPAPAPAPGRFGILERLAAGPGRVVSRRHVLERS
ncbi:hypothetical protein [Streptomyces sediminimaris]|uniref:hypothetical protein n=1 Tax=Streptomyces sediminimaris TaxID=3383721 RepID=UPI00399A2A43